MLFVGQTCEMPCEGKDDGPKLMYLPAVKDATMKRRRLKTRNIKRRVLRPESVLPNFRDFRDFRDCSWGD